MNIIRVELAPEFRGEDVVLLAMDGAGVTTFVTALSDAEQRGSSQLEHDGVTHQFVIQAAAADIERGGNLVVWRCRFSNPMSYCDPLTCGDRAYVASCHQTFVSDSCPRH